MSINISQNLFTLNKYEVVYKIVTKLCEWIDSKCVTIFDGHLANECQDLAIRILRLAKLLLSCRVID